MREAPGQEWRHYTQWEDWQAGMYRHNSTLTKTKEAAAILSSPSMFYEAGSQAIAAWPNATAQNLTNLYVNHQPWIGRVACSYVAGATIADTTTAWCSLSPSTQIAANQVADYIADKWRAANTKGQTTWTL